MHVHRGPSGVDIDNGVKVLLDALKGVVIDDDKQITDLKIRKTDQDLVTSFSDLPSKVLEHIGRDDEFVYVRIAVGPDHTRFVP